MLSVHFLAVFMHYQRFNTFAVRTRNCRLLQRHFRDVALTSAKITDITLSRMTLAPAAILCPGIGTRSRKECQNVEKVKNLGSYIPYGLFQTKGEICAKSGSDWFRNVNLYKVQKKKKNTHTHKQGNKQNFQLYISEAEPLNSIFSQSVRLLGGSVSSTFLQSATEIFSRANEWKIFAQYQLLSRPMTHFSRVLDSWQSQ